MPYPQQSVLPNSFHGSTTFNSQIKSYNHLAQRVRRSLGEPLIQLEISSEQMYELIDISLEYFTKFAGVEEEYLVFRSDLYKKGVGLHIGELMNITPDMYKDNTSNPSLSASFDYDLDDLRGFLYDLRLFFELNAYDNGIVLLYFRITSLNLLKKAFMRLSILSRLYILSLGKFKNVRGPLNSITTFSLRGYNS